MDRRWTLQILHRQGHRNYLWENDKISRITARIYSWLHRI